jgi:DNA-binding MarR family transcriptional regulator
MNQKFVRKFREVLRRLDRELFLQNVSSCCNGVTTTQCHTLLEMEGITDISVTELSKNLMLDKSTVSRTVDGLVNIGLVDRVIPSENRRMTTLNLTENGKKTCENIHWYNDRYAQDALSVLSEEEQEELVRLLDKVTLKMVTLRDNYNNTSSNCCD